MLYDVPYGFKVQVEINRAEHAEVIVHAPCYVNKQWKMSHCYDLSFTDSQILKDHTFTTVMCNHFP